MIWDSHGKEAKKKIAEKKPKKNGSGITSNIQTFVTLDAFF